MALNSEHIWPIASVVEDQIQFEEPDGLLRAFNLGFFYVRQPEPKILLDAGDEFACSFYLEGDCERRSYRQLGERETGRFQGFFEREEDQTEQFFLESRNWHRLYPADLERQARFMQVFGVSLLRSILQRIGVPDHMWRAATGGATECEGTYTLTFNHFRPWLNRRGLNVHKDSGWITLLRSVSPGLEVLVGDRWEPVLPMKDTFIVNFGCAFEIFTKEMSNPVKAAPHRVVQQHDTSGADRFSYGLFIDNGLSEGAGELFYLSRDGDLKFYCSFETFLEKILTATYDKDGVGLYTLE